MGRQNPSLSGQHIIKVAKMHEEELDSIDESMSNKLSAASTDISQTEELLAELGYDICNATADISIMDISPVFVEDWDSIVDRADKLYPETISIEDVFTKDELTQSHAYIVSLQNQFKDLNELDKWDYATAGVVGTLAALMDFFLVTKVNLPNGVVDPGVLKSGVQNLWDKFLSPDKVALLEAKYKVPFDIPTNTSKISQEILGLNPKTHRFQSLGHDPILGFIFGVKDLIHGELTAIDGNGRLIIQNVSGTQGKGFIESVINEFGHLLSDVNASSSTGMKLSIPAPLTPLLQMIQVGSATYNGKSYTIGELSKRMYYDGFNFNHFLGMSIPVVIIHIVIRLYTVLREMFSEGYTRTKHKSDILLFVANSILCAENVGKLVVTKNPFAINYVSWVDTSKYAVRTMKFVLIDYHLEQIGYIQKIIDQEFTNTYDTIENTWNQVCADRPVFYL